MTALNPGSLDAGWFRQRYARHDSHCPDILGPSCSRLPDLAKSPADVRIGHARGRLDGHDAGAVFDGELVMLAGKGWLG
jgi:hypothetical protein